MAYQYGHSGVLQLLLSAVCSPRATPEVLVPLDGPGRYGAAAPREAYAAKPGCFECAVAVSPCEEHFCDAAAA